MNKKIKIVLVIIVLIVVAFFAARYYAYHGGKRDIQAEETAFSVTAKSITQEFTTNVEASNKKYLEKPITVSGIVTSVNATEVIIDNSVNCNFLKADASIKNGQNITVKGRVIGYDDLLGEVKIDQCNISTN